MLKEFFGLLGLLRDIKIVIRISRVRDIKIAIRFTRVIKSY